jgi:uncharacterized membrane protein YqgA involved in biofilm formation
MHPIFRNILAVVVGVIVGGMVNMGIIMGGMALLPAPDGVDIMDVGSINAHIHEYTFAQMMVPFLAHALGTLVGAFLAAKIAANRKMVFAIGIGLVFLWGGVDMVRQISNAPVWFNVLDLVVAYIPMAWIGGTLGMRGSR